MQNVNHKSKYFNQKHGSVKLNRAFDYTLVCTPRSGVLQTARYAGKFPNLQKKFVLLCEKFEC